MRRRTVIAAVAMLGLLFGQAQAAPQILGLVASNGVSTPLHCRDRACTGYLASFCLQEARDAPAIGQEYTVAPGGSLTLIAASADGRRLRLPVDDLLTIYLRSGFTSVRIGFPAARLDGLGAGRLTDASLAVEVGPGTTILPVQAADDPDPQSPEEIAQATGPLRHLAAETFDGSSELTDAARLIGLLVNRLPTGNAPGPVDLDRLFQQALASIGPGHLDGAGVAAAGRIARSCRLLVNPPTSFSLGACLDNEQNTLLATLNAQFWTAAGGS